MAPRPFVRLALVLAVLSIAGCRRSAPVVPAPAPVPPAAPVVEEEPPPQGRHLALLYSSNVRGEYEPCG